MKLLAKLRGKRRKLASAQFSLAPGQTKRVSARIRRPLRRAALRKARRKAGLRVRASITTGVGKTSRRVVVRRR